MKAFLRTGSRWFADTPIEVMDRWLADPQLLDWFSRAIELTELQSITPDALYYVARPVLLVGSPIVAEQTEHTSQAAALRGALANCEAMLSWTLGPFLASVIGAQSSRRREPWEPPIGLPPGPLCERCEHSLCPCCPVAWCDTLVPVDCSHCGSTGLAPYMDPATGAQPLCAFCEGDMSLCCDSECKVDPADFAAWQAQLRAVGAFGGALGPVTLQEGPFWPAAARGKP